MKISPLPGRMSARGRCPTWPSVPSSSRACRNRMRCRGFVLVGSSGPPALSAHLFDLLVAMIYGSPAFIQDGVMPALERDLPEVAALREAYRNRAGMLSEILSEAPNCRVTRPEGGMFVLMDIRGTGVASTAFAHDLLMHGTRRRPAVRQLWAERRRTPADIFDRPRAAPRRGRPPHRPLRPQHRRLAPIISGARDPVVPPVNASYLHERLRPRFVTGLAGESSMSAPFGEIATDADVTRILHGRPAALDPKRSLARSQDLRRCYPTAVIQAQRRGSTG